MKKLIFYIISLLLLSSCEKFLDVQPESDITKEQLFNTEEGFKEALNGVYSYCSSTDLYGGNLTFSNLDIMAQNYTTSDVFLRQIASFKYNENVLKDKNTAIWKFAYKAVGDCNQILSVIDEKKGLFRDQNYSIIKGETLALRAYLHFDLLRMFAPSFKNDPNSVAIPYVTKTGITSTPFSSVTEVLNQVVADLMDAKALLETADPILLKSYVVGYPKKKYPDNFTGVKQTETANPSLFLQNRRHRMNFYAVCAELARVHLYKADYANSLLYAQKVIDSEKFPFAAQADVFNADIEQQDKIFYPELIAGWNLPKKAIEDLTGLFSKEGKADYTPGFEQLVGIYESGSGGIGGEDWRYKVWFKKIEDKSPKQAYLIKYTTNTTPQENLHPVMAPALRLSEMYYIAAEASFDTDPAKAIEYVNTIRRHRGINDMLPANTGKPQFMDALVKECRKEFYGESQIFFMYKRLNLDITSSTAIYKGSNNIYVFPVPLDELAYNN